MRKELNKIKNNKKSLFENTSICDTQGKYTCTFPQVCLPGGIQHDKG